LKPYTKADIHLKISRATSFHTYPELARALEHINSYFKAETRALIKCTPRK